MGKGLEDLIREEFEKVGIPVAYIRKIRRSLDLVEGGQLTCELKRDSIDPKKTYLELTSDSKQSSDVIHLTFTLSGFKFGIGTKLDQENSTHGYVIIDIDKGRYSSNVEEPYRGKIETILKGMIYPR